MYAETCRDEVIVKLVGKLTLEYPNIDQLKVREIVENVLYKYTIGTEEQGLMASDIHEKAEIFMATRKLEGKSETTLKNNRYDLIKFANVLIKPVEQITTNDLRMYLVVRCKDLKENSTNAQITLLKTFFSWLHIEEYISRDPSAKLKRVKEPIRLRQPLNNEETVILREGATDLRKKAILELLLNSGARLSEIEGMNKKDINWLLRSIRVIGKGNKERIVYFSTQAGRYLHKYIESRVDNNEALFVASKGVHARLGGRSIEKEVNKIAKNAGLDKPVFPHLCRHTMATYSINAGMPLEKLQKILGHVSPSTTLHYGKTLDENIRHEYNRIIA